MGHSYPILLDVSTRKIVIVGGGRVASRKAASLIECGATNVTVISPQFVAEFPRQVIKIEKIYESGMLEGAALAFAATNRPEVNAQVVIDAQARNILVNRADADEEAPGDFVTPAKFQDHNVLLTVSAASAALAASIRDALQRRWDPRWTKMGEAMQTLRPWVKSRPRLSIEQRGVIFRLMVGNEAMDILDTGGIDRLREWLIEKHPELSDG
ncbi:MAG: NAD(P)-dependent oxidoreductase [Burkholderiales bacterium]|nr:NAD(P)-dependent oxidoreductase [Phycisphaerae bacterium]